MQAKKSTKLTLVVDPVIVDRAKSYAAAHDTSVSALIEAYLKQLTYSARSNVSTDPRTWPPLTRSLLGTLRTRKTKVINYDAEKLKRLTKKYLHD